MLKVGRAILQPKQIDKGLILAANFSSKSSNKWRKQIKSKRGNVATDGESSNREINLFAPKDVRLPLPGNIGIVPPPPPDVVIAINNKTLRFLRNGEFDEDGSEELDMALLNDQKDDATINKLVNLNCIAYNCPWLMFKEFQELFPNRIVGLSATLLLFSQKSFSNLTLLNEESVRCRQEIMHDFVDIAETFCIKLRDAGYWADYIDPSNDNIDVKNFTNSKLYEISGRYKQFGFSIEQRGQCRIVSHHRWGTQAFVGTLLTDASIDSIELREILASFTDQ